MCSDHADIKTLLIWVYNLLQCFLNILFTEMSILEKKINLYITVFSLACFIYDDIMSLNILATLSF